MKIQITYKMAMAAGRDAANRSMMKAGRTEWTRDDRNIGAVLVTKLLAARVTGKEAA